MKRKYKFVKRKPQVLSRSRVDGKIELDLQRCPTSLLLSPIHDSTLAIVFDPRYGDGSVTKIKISSANRGIDVEE